MSGAPGRALRVFKFRIDQLKIVGIRIAIALALVDKCIIAIVRVHACY